MIPPVFISHKNNRIWIEREPEMVQNVYKIYKKVIPIISNIEMFHYHFFENSHFLNDDFKNNPIYCIALKEGSIPAISVLYIDERYRRQGLASNLIKKLFLDSIPPNQVIQVAIDQSKYNELKKFYSKLGFKGTGIFIKDGLSINYTDMFYSKTEFTIQYDKKTKKNTIKFKT